MYYANTHQKKAYVAALVSYWCVTNYRGLRGFKQHRCGIFLFWRSQVQSQLHRARAEVSAELVALSGSVLCLSRLPGPASSAWLLGPSCCHSNLRRQFPTPDSALLSPSYKKPCEHTGLPQITQNNVPISRYLLQSCLQSPFRHVR